MRRPAAVAVTAVLCACAGGYTQGGSDFHYDGGPLGGGASGADGGRDAGPDGGTDAGADAGCAALTLPGVPAIDGCHQNASTTATGTVNVANCSLDLTIPTFAGPCSGTVSGPSDAFDGGCEGGAWTCTSSSLPGDLTCTISGTVCAIRICDAGAACP